MNPYMNTFVFYPPMTPTPMPAPGDPAGAPAAGAPAGFSMVPGLVQGGAPAGPPPPAMPPPPPGPPGPPTDMPASPPPPKLVQATPKWSQPRERVKVGGQVDHMQCIIM